MENLIPIIKYLNQIISENKPYNLRLCTFTFHKFEEKHFEPEPGFEHGPSDSIPIKIILIIIRARSCHYKFYENAWRH